MVTRAEWENGFKEGRRHADRNVSRVITAELNEYCLHVVNHFTAVYYAYCVFFFYKGFKGYDKPNLVHT